MPMNTITEEDSDSFDSNTDVIIYGVYDDSGSGESLISDPNIPSSSSSSKDDDLLQQQMISTAAAVDGADTDDLTVPTSASFSWALSSEVNNEIEIKLLWEKGKRRGK
ncbi:hypothetical protein RDI58_013771 [Solanum bulbocastanum]|uniref:Uncharacterized protein n=1 Tax=Solanum bulbocastanum TaxID=147425 RepID=A0AAN8YFI4_SOLBU